MRGIVFVLSLYKTSSTQQQMRQDKRVRSQGKTNHGKARQGQAKSGEKS